MIRHIVLVRFSPDVTEGDRLALLDRIHDLRGVIPGLIDTCAGRSDSPEQMERGYLHGFTADFTSWEALAEYQAHPEHKAFGAALIEAALDGREGLLVFDLEIPQHHVETRDAAA